MTTEAILSLDDIRSTAWRKVKAYAEAELEMHRKTLESDLLPEKTAKVRGQIRSLVLLLALETPPAPALEETEDDE